MNELEALAKALTPKERAFAEAYAGQCRGNATRAAEAAGYKASKLNTLAAIGYENLRKPHVAAYKDALLTVHAMSAAEVIREIGDIAKQDLTPYLVRQGSEMVLDYAKMEAEGALHLIAGFEFNKQGEKVAMIHSKLAALTLMVRILKLGGDTVEHDHSHTVTVREYPEGV